MGLIILTFMEEVIGIMGIVLLQLKCPTLPKIKSVIVPMLRIFSFNKATFCGSQNQWLKITIFENMEVDKLNFSLPIEAI